MKRSVFASICVGVLMFLVAGMQEARAQNDLPQTTTLIVKVAPGVSPADADATIRRHGGTPKTSVARLGMYVVEVAEADAEAIKKSLEEDPAVARVEENRSRKLSAIPSDALFTGQWALRKMAWTEVYGNVSTTALVDVAILDTGIDAAHPDLIGAIGPGTSFIDDSNGRTDTNGHGTWVAGIVAGRTNNLDGIAGIAYSNVQILPVKVLDASGLGQDIDIIQGVLWAVDHGASVILMAFSNEGFSQSLQDAIDYAWSRNIVLVAAVGNEGTNAPNFPAGDKGVIGVSATDQNDELATSSNYGSSVFLAAPGVDIVSTYKDGGYVSWSGSSASAAMVAGAAALMRAVDGTLTNGVVVSRLARTADPAGTQEQTGNGRVQIARALADTTMDEIQPAGTPPVGDGGPFVGPYRAAACTVSGVSVVSQSPALAAPGETITYTNINLTKSNGNCSGTWSITWTGGTPSGTTTAFSPATFTGSGTSKLTTLTITTNAGSTPTGTREFKVSAGGSDTGGTVTSNNFSFALDKASQTISFAALANKTYGAADFGVSATASSGLPVSFTASGNCNVLSETVHIVAAGSCTITAKQGGDATYYAAPDESRTFSIARADVSVVISPYAVGYDGNPHTATGSAIGVFSEALAGLDLSGTTHANAGSYPTDPWTFTDVTGNYNDAAGTVSNSINKANANITVTGFSGTYDGNPHGVISSSAKGINNEDLTGLVIATTTYMNVPGGNVHWTFTNTNYNDQSGDAAVTISKADATITVTGFSGTYDGNPHGVISSSAKGINNEDLTGLVIEATTYTNAPGGNVHWTFTNTNYNDQSGDAAVTISKADATITVTGFSGTYDGNPHGVISSSAKGINNEDLTGLVIEATTYTNAPGGNVHWTFTNTNYNDQSGDAAVTISKADATITVTGFSGTYDGNPHGVISSSAKGINNEDLTGLVIEATTYTNAPGGNVHWTFTNTNYNDQSGDAIVTIDKADATITVTGFSGTYDGNPHGVVSSSAKGINNENLTGLVIAATTYTNVPGGNIHWTFTNTNYNNQSGDAPVTISVAPLTITANNKTKTYGTLVTFDTTTPSADFSVAGLAGGDTVNSITLTSAGAAAAATVVGSPYAITPSAAVGSGLNNYAIQYVAGQLTMRYGVCLQYDALKAHKKGSTIPIKINLCDGAGNNVSSAEVVVTATTILKLDSTASPFEAEDSGSANPDSNFRFAGGFYIFNLSLKNGFDRGTYRMSFVVNGQSDPNYSLGFDVK